MVWIFWNIMDKSKNSETGFEKCEGHVCYILQSISGTVRLRQFCVFTQSIHFRSMVALSTMNNSMECNCPSAHINCSLPIYSYATMQKCATCDQLEPLIFWKMITHSGLGCSFWKSTCQYCLQWYFVPLFGSTDGIIIEYSNSQYFTDHWHNRSRRNLSYHSSRTNRL